MSEQLWDLKVRVDESRTGGEYLTEEEWSDRAPEYVEFERLVVEAVPIDEKELARKIAGGKDVYTGYGSPDTTATIDSAGKCGPGTPVYVVTVTYSSGDTFGNTYGLTAIYDVFTDPEQAARLQQTIEKVADFKLEEVDGVVTNWDFEFEGRKYSKCWAGYFEEFQQCQVHTELVQLGQSRVQTPRRGRRGGISR